MHTNCAYAPRLFWLGLLSSHSVEPVSKHFWLSFIYDTCGYLSMQRFDIILSTAVRRKSASARLHCDDKVCSLARNAIPSNDKLFPLKNALRMKSTALFGFFRGIYDPNKSHMCDRFRSGSMNNK